MIFKYFPKSKKYKGYTAVVVSKEVEDELTGVTVIQDFHYIYLGKQYLSKFINKEVELTLVKSPKLGFDVCTSVKLASKEPSLEDLIEA